jgi:hypothetical protein
VDSLLAALLDGMHTSDIREVHNMHNRARLVNPKRKQLRQVAVNQIPGDSGSNFLSNSFNNLVLGMRITNLTYIKSF